MDNYNYRVRFSIYIMVFKVPLRFIDISYMFTIDTIVWLGYQYDFYFSCFPKIKCSITRPS